MNLLKRLEKNYEMVFYLTVLSIFLSEFKLYIPLFFLNIMYVVFLAVKKEIRLNFTKWNKALIMFLIWVIINSVITPLIYKTKLDLVLLIKLFLNFGFMFATSIMIDNKRLIVKKDNFVKLVEVIILINFIQVIVIYFKGGFFTEFINGNLTESSDAAYAVSNYTNIIGVSNKNIWASKLTMFYLIYLYIVDNKYFMISKYEKIIFILMGAITIILLLSRTAQLALIIPLLYFAIKNLNKLSSKYKFVIYIMFAIVGILGGVIFFTKFFHIKFDMTDGGFTRLYIWSEGLKEFFKKYLIIGGGVGSSTFFIQNVLGRFESNMHNVLINIFFELGLVGGILYLNFIREFFKGYCNKENLIKLMMILLMPILLIISLQYLGYDNDLIVFLLFIEVINEISRRRVGCYSEI